MNAPSAEVEGSLQSRVLEKIAPTRPSRLRLTILWIILLLWVITLIVVYFTTVRPRQPSPPERGLALVRPAEIG